jgi:nicotinamide-nucleotide amidase
MKRVELLTIGSELLSGATVNTNAAELARALASTGLPCSRQTAVGDEAAGLQEALAESLARTELLVTTGGLGPTFDDVTIETIARQVGRPLVHHEPIARQIRRFYARSRRALQRAALRQALLPAGAVALPNPIGTAPGMWLELPGVLIVALPGVPSEMRAIFARQVLPRLRRRPGLPATPSLTLRTIGIVELSIEAALRRLRLPAAVEVGLYPHLRAVDVRFTATAASQVRARQLAERACRRLERALGAAVYGRDAETLEGAVGRLLAARRLTLGVAESCTGGAIGERLTRVPGSSAYFRGGVIAYHDDVKRSAVGVPAPLLRRRGAVSAAAAAALARGARRATGASMALSVTGIAGPSGGSKTKPVGLVYAGLADARRTLTRRWRFFGDRAAVRTQAVQAALDWLRLDLLQRRTRARG